MSEIIYRFECLGCGLTGSATHKLDIPCVDCGGELEYKMIIPQGTDEAAPKSNVGDK